MDNLEKRCDVYTFAHDVIKQAREETKKWKTAFFVELFVLVASNACWFIAWMK